MFKAGKQHIADAGITYFQHQRIAFHYAGQCFYAGFMALIHGVFPNCYRSGASSKVAELATLNKTNKNEADKK